MRRWFPPPSDVVRVHRAATQVEALALEQALRSGGIRVWLRSRQVPGYADVVAAASGVWGDVLVAPEDAESAQTIVSDYLSSTRSRADHSREVPRVQKFAGIIPPLVTLFDRSGRVDDEAMGRHVDRLIGAGVHALFGVGSTGEVMHLLPEERRHVAELIVEQADGRVPVLIGCAGTGTEEVIAYVRHTKEVGAAAAVVIIPYYWVLSDRNIEAHFAAIADAVDIPILIYNFPAVSGRNLPAPLIARVAGAHSNIVGIKETIDSIGHIQQVLAHVRPVRPDFSVLCGYEYHLLNTLLLGGDGSIPGMANVTPAESVAIYEAFRRGDIEGAAERARARLDVPSLYQLDAPLFVVVKEAMALLGLIDHATVRLPALPLSDEARARLHRLLASIGML